MVPRVSRGAAATGRIDREQLALGEHDAGAAGAVRALGVEGPQLAEAWVWLGAALWLTSTRFTH